MPINENSERKVALTIYSNDNNSKIFNLLNMEHNIIDMSLKIFFTSIHDFLPHQLCRPSIHTTQPLDSHMKSPRGLCGKSSKS